MNTLHLRTSQLFELPLVAESFQTVLTKLTEHTGKLLIIFTPNSEQIALTKIDPQFFQDLQDADLLLPDGIGVVAASRLLAVAGKATLIPERITGIDVVVALLNFAATHKKKVLVIGGRGYGAETLAKKGASVLRILPKFISSLENTTQTQQYLWFEGYHDVRDTTDSEETEVLEVIKSVHPQYLFIALGAPYQERWLLRHRKFLESENIEIAMAVGGTFDILSGTLARAPKLLRDLHLEWLYRLYQEPWRWRRQTKLLLFIKEAVRALFVR